MRERLTVEPGVPYPQTLGLWGDLCRTIWEEKMQANLNSSAEPLPETWGYKLFHLRRSEREEMILQMDTTDD